MRQRMVMDSGGGLRVGSLLRLACASNSKPDVAIRCGMHGCWAQEVGKALIAKASSFNAKQAWVRNHMADLLPSLTESILYIYIYTAIFGCLWMMTIWTYYQGSPFFSDASSVFLRNSCSRDVLVTGFCLIRFLWWNLDGTISWVLWALFIVHFFVLDVRSSSRSWGTWEVLTEDSDSEGRNLKFLVGEAVTAECLVSRGFD